MQSFCSRGSCQCLEGISDFVKLRFLGISGHRQPLSLSLSKSICKFYFLQVLICSRYHGALKKDAHKLTNLRHLYGVKGALAEVGKLTSLQELCFSVGTKPGYRIDELMNMANLHKLSILKLSKVPSLEEANKVNLVSKSSLTRLRLGWDKICTNPDLDQQVLGALRPPPTIRELFITEYKGDGPVPWMDTSSLSWLESLELSACTCLEELPPLWKLPCLKFLNLNQMLSIRSLGCDSSDQMDIQFPILEKLVFKNFPLWEEWNGADDYIWFPHLKNFVIEECPKLKKIPDLPLSIENLYLRNLGLEALPRSYRCSNGFRTFGGINQLMSLESLKIYKCSGIAHIGSIGDEDDNLLPSSLKGLELEILDKNEDLASYLRGLTSLADLFLHCSPGMESLPLASELEHLTALQDLIISDGEALTSPGGLSSIKSLRHLIIDDCPKFLSAEVESQEFLKGKTRKHAVSSSSVFYHSASDKAASILPSSLESLFIFDSDISQESLGRCLQGLTSLEHLEVFACQHLVSLPNREYLHNLTALSVLKITDCKELCELESLTALVSLIVLEIKQCPKLLATTSSILQNPAATPEQGATKIKKGTLPSLQSVDIDNIFYLPILPISERLEILSIQNITENSEPVAEFTCFPSEIEEWLLQCRESLADLLLGGMLHLQSLPASLENFSSLETFRISSAPKLESLPRMPASLEELTIGGCSAKMKKRCQENIGPDWPKIDHILEISIEADEEDEDKDKARVNCNWISRRLCNST